MEPEDYRELCYRLRLEHEKYEMRMAGCVGKHRFDSPQQARLGMRHMDDGNPAVFKCVFCGKWHVGSRHQAEGKEVEHQDAWQLLMSGS